MGIQHDTDAVQLRAVRKHGNLVPPPATSFLLLGFSERTVPTCCCKQRQDRQLSAKLLVPYGCFTKLGMSRIGGDWASVCPGTQ